MFSNLIHLNLSYFSYKLLNKYLKLDIMFSSLIHLKFSVLCLQQLLYKHFKLQNMFLSFIQLNLFYFPTNY